MMSPFREVFEILKRFPCPQFVGLLDGIESVGADAHATAAGTAALQN
jgi:hypothetical protein